MKRILNFFKKIEIKIVFFLGCRFVFVANAIVALYSVFEMGTCVWEFSREATLWPEAFQVWFDFGHDQVNYFSIQHYFKSLHKHNTETSLVIKVNMFQ